VIQAVNERADILAGMLWGDGHLHGLESSLLTGGREPIQARSPRNRGLWSERLSGMREKNWNEGAIQSVCLINFKFESQTNPARGVNKLPVWTFSRAQQTPQFMGHSWPDKQGKQFSL
jgi:hypothetical protein